MVLAFNVYLKKMGECWLSVDKEYNSGPGLWRCFGIESMLEAEAYAYLGSGIDSRFDVYPSNILSLKPSLSRL